MFGFRKKEIPREDRGNAVKAILEGFDPERPLLKAIEHAVGNDVPGQRRATDTG